MSELAVSILVGGIDKVESKTMVDARLYKHTLLFTGSERVFMIPIGREKEIDEIIAAVEEIREIMHRAAGPNQLSLKL
jgi:hypothetical protein